MQSKTNKQKNLADNILAESPGAKNTKRRCKNEVLECENICKEVKSFNHDGNDIIALGGALDTKISCVDMMEKFEGGESYLNEIKKSLYKRAIGGEIMEETADYELKNGVEYIFCKKQNAIFTPFGVLYDFNGDNASFKFRNKASIEKLKNQSKVCSVGCGENESVEPMVLCKAGFCENIEKGGACRGEEEVELNKSQKQKVKKNLSNTQDDESLGVEQGSNRMGGDAIKNNENFCKLNENDGNLQNLGQVGGFWCEKVSAEFDAGKMVCVKKKVAKKFSPPDTQAIKMLIELNDSGRVNTLGLASELDQLNNMQLEKMKNDLIKRILE